MKAKGLSGELERMHKDIALGIPNEMHKHIVGARYFIKALLVTLLSSSGNRQEGVEEFLGHMLVEGEVGGGKTFIAKTFAHTIGGVFSRIQFMRGLKPQHLRQTVRQLEDGSLEFSKGPLHANIILGDEVNRGTDITHAALMDALAEGVVEINGEEFRTPRPYLFIGTGNPRDLQGVSKLGVAMSDRLVFKVRSPEYTEEEEREIVARQEERADKKVEVICKPDDILNFCDNIHKEIEFSPSVARFLVRIIRRTRDVSGFADQDDITAHGTSGERPGTWLYRVAKVNAFLGGRMYVAPDDVLAHIHDLLSHRIDLGYVADSQNRVRDFIDSMVREEMRHAAGITS